MKLCAYAIAKNEEQNIHTFLDQTQLFDYVVVLDTGSTDQTVKLLRNRGVTVFQTTFEEFDFAKARNHAMSLTPEDSDWLFSIDFNERFTITQNVFDTLASTEVDGFTVMLTTELDPSYQERKLKVHKRNGFEWKYAVHEELWHSGLSVGELELTVKKNSSMELIEKKEEFYVSIAERELKKYPREHHYIWWLIRYYNRIKNSERVVDLCFQYLNCTTPYTIEFRIDALVFLSEYATNLENKIDMAIRALSESLSFKTHTMRPFVLAVTHMKKIGLSMDYQGAKLI